MKFFIAIALIATVASASVIRPEAPSVASAIAQILEALGSLRPPTAVGPAIVGPENPISVGPSIIESSPIALLPEIVDFPMPDGGVVAEDVIAPSPVVIVPGPVADAPASGAPLVQIILNINQAAAESVVAPEPIGVLEVAPVQIVEVDPEPVQVVEVAPEPVQVVEVAPEPVQVIESAPVPVEPVLIGTPIIPAPAVVLPEQLN